MFFGIQNFSCIFFKKMQEKFWRPKNISSKILEQKKIQEKNEDQKKNLKKKNWRAQKISRIFFASFKKIFIRKKSKVIQKKMLKNFCKKKGGTRRRRI